MKYVPVPPPEMSAQRWPCSARKSAPGHRALRWPRRRRGCASRGRARACSGPRRPGVRAGSGCRARRSARRSAAGPRSRAPRSAPSRRRARSGPPSASRPGAAARDSCSTLRTSSTVTVIRCSRASSATAATLSRWTTWLAISTSAIPPRGHHDRLPRGGAGDAHRPRLDRHPRQLDRLVDLDVRPQLGRELLELGGHRRDVAPGDVEVEQQGGCRDLRARSADLAAVALDELLAHGVCGAAHWDSFASSTAVSRSPVMPRVCPPSITSIWPVT